MASWDTEDADEPDDGSTSPWATRRSGPYPTAAAFNPARLLRKADDFISLSNHACLHSPRRGGLPRG